MDQYTQKNSASNPASP